MAISNHHEQIPSSILDTLFCDEDHWEDEEDEEEDQEQEDQQKQEMQNEIVFPMILFQQDLFVDDKELASLFSKEIKQGISNHGNFDYLFSSARKQAVEWILMVNTLHGFSTLTSILAVNYLDKFFSIIHFQNDKPWTMQLAAVTCLSLAAKVEETYVPLLLDLQVEGTKYMFKAKDIQKMELLVLSTLEWKMNWVTPLCFLEVIIKRLRLQNHVHWELLRRCERFLISVLPDWRLVRYEPSVLATATMMHVIDQIEGGNNPHHYQHQLLSVLNISKEKVKECYEVMRVERFLGGSNKWETTTTTNENGSKRMHEDDMMPGSPSGVIEASSYYAHLSCTSDSSNDSWASTIPTLTLTPTPTPTQVNNNGMMMMMNNNSNKKRRMNERTMPFQLHA